jgi:hypothetical protein
LPLGESATRPKAECSKKLAMGGLASAGACAGAAKAAGPAPASRVVRTRPDNKARRDGMMILMKIACEHMRSCTKITVLLA